MKICMITSAGFPPREGIGNYVTALSRELVSRGHEVVILTRGSAKRCYEQTMDGLHVIRVPYLPLYPLHADIHGAFVKSVVNSRFDEADIYHHHSPLVKHAGNGRPVVTTVHTPMAFDVPRIEVTDARSLGARFVMPTASARIEKSLFNKSNLLATVSTQVSKELTSMNLKCRSIRYIGNGVDHHIFQPKNAERDFNSVLCVGRISYRKGHPDLIEAARLVLSALPETVFKIAGEGPLLPKLKKLVRERGLEGNFQFLGRVSTDNLVALYQNCGVFVLPSHYEGMATVLLEAMACGAPVISTNVGGSTDLIEDRKNGLLVPIQDHRSLADAIIELLRNPEVGTVLGAKACSTIQHRFTWREICSRYEDVYAEMLSSRNTRNPEP